jgi:hypothetical protein
MRKVLGYLLAAAGLFLCVFVAYAPYSLLETYGNPDVGVVANVEPFLGLIVVGALVSLLVLAAGMSLLAPRRVTAAVTVIALLAMVGGGWLGAERGIDAKEQGLSQPS